MKKFNLKKPAMALGVLSALAFAAPVTAHAGYVGTTNTTEYYQFYASSGLKVPGTDYWTNPVEFTCRYGFYLTIKSMVSWPVTSDSSVWSEVINYNVVPINN